MGNALLWAENTRMPNIQQGSASDEKGLNNAIEVAALQKYDVILIDTAGINTAFSQYVLSVSNLVVLPFDTGQYDLNGVINTLQRIERTAKMCKKLIRTVLVANRYNPQHKIAKHIIHALKQKGDGYNILYGCPYLTGFKQMADGGLPEGSALKAAKQFLAVLQTHKHLHFYNK